MTPQALLIEPDQVQREALCGMLRRDDWRVRAVRSLAEAVQVGKECRRRWSLAFCALGEREASLHSLSGLRRVVGEGVPIILLSAHVTPHTMIDAMTHGAFAVLRKPYRETEVRERARFIQRRVEAAAGEAAEGEDRTTAGAHGTGDVSALSSAFDLVGNSAAMTSVTAELAKALRDDGEQLKDRGANHSSRVVRCAPSFFVTGETGTGKELVARAIHRHSRYHRGPFVALNCSNLPVEIADAELFGSTPGAFTGALTREQPGWWERAAGGTLFLDEITEAPSVVQAKMLRVLQFGEFTRLGAKRTIRVDVQVVAASNRNIPREIKEGRFREDLYHRLSLHHLRLPPLRERQADVPLLAAHFARLHSANHVRLANGALKLLAEFSRSYAWGGNVRELENVIRRAVKESPDRMVHTVDLLPHLPASAPEDAVAVRFTGAGGGERVEWRAGRCNGVGVSDTSPVGLDECVRQYRDRLLRDALQACDGNRSRAARTLGISRTKLHRLLK